MKDPTWLERVIEVFDKESEELVSEVPLRAIAVEMLQTVFGCAANDPMVDSYNISAQQAGLLRVYTDCHFDFDRFDYFLAAYTTDFQRAIAEGGYAGRYPPPRDLPAFPEFRQVKPKSHTIDD